MTTDMEAPAPRRHRRRLLAHPATLALAGAGSSVLDLAAALNVSPSCASMYMAGTRRTPEHLPGVLSDLVGKEAAARVLALIPVKTEAA